MSILKEHTNKSDNGKFTPKLTINSKFINIVSYD